MFQVSRPYLGFCHDPKHFIVNCEPNVVNFAGKCIEKCSLSIKYFDKIKCYVDRPYLFFSELRPETHIYIFYALWILRRKFLNIFFENLAFGCHGNQSKISDLDKIHMTGRGLLQEHYCKTFCQNICSNTEINANFHFSHCKSMETLSCHSNEITWATIIKNIIYVETNLMNTYAKFQLHPPYGFWEENFLPFMLPWQPIRFSDVNIWIVEDYSTFL